MFIGLLSVWGSAASVVNVSDYSKCISFYNQSCMRGSTYSY